MRGSLELLLGLLDGAEPAWVATEDWLGEHGPGLRVWQRMGILDREPGLHPVPGCPHCEGGEPYRVGRRLVCHRCRSSIGPEHRLLWRLDHGCFLRWLADRLGLRGGVQRIGERLWQLGTLPDRDGIHEVFYRRTKDLSEKEQGRLSAFRNVVVLYGGPVAPVPREWGRTVSLVALLRLDAESLSVADLRRFLRPPGGVVFDVQSGTLWVGDERQGDVPRGSKEFAFLDCLAQNLDHFVAYEDLKHAVQRQSGSVDSTEEATFCQNLKSRIKKKWIPAIDRLLVTTNKGDGYRLRGYVDV